MALQLFRYNIRNIEPVKRNKDGLRWISHRFPIKGGISWHEAMIRDMSEPNMLLAAMLELSTAA